MRESQYLKTIETRGKVEQARADVLTGLSLKLGSPVPESIRLAVEGTNDLNHPTSKPASKVPTLVPRLILRGPRGIVMTRPRHSWLRTTT